MVFANGIKYTNKFFPTMQMNKSRDIICYLHGKQGRFRIPKLPVGVDCTLSIMQVCLRDREWTPKINSGELSINYENDLCLMYSTTIMRILNHISNIGHTKQTSLFQIAKQLNIPEWIVNLRHDTAHGYELPSIGVLRIAANILLAWIHEEYWVSEIKQMQICLDSEDCIKEAQEKEEVQDFDDLIELWTAVSLYIHAGHRLVSKIPDLQLKETLQDLRSYAISVLEENNKDMENDNYMNAINDNLKKDKKYTLETARIVLLSEISRFLNRKSIPNKKDIVCNALFNTEAFLPSQDTLLIFTHKRNARNELEDNILPLDMIKFWKDIIFLLHEKNLMEELLLELLKLMNNDQIPKCKRLLASLWISSISYCFLKLDYAQCISRDLEYKLEKTQKKLTPIAFQLKVKYETHRIYPHLRDVLWFNLSDVILPCLTDINFVTKLILNANEFSTKFISPMLELLSPKIDKKSKELLINLVNIYTIGKIAGESLNENDKTFTVEDIQYSKRKLNKSKEENKSENETIDFLVDKKVRNSYWKIALTNCNWTDCPVGILPWQRDTLEVFEPLKTVTQKHNASVLGSEIIPGFIDQKDLGMQSEIDWDNVLRKKKRMKRKHEQRNADIIVNRALEAAKKQK
nr:PREDICTED: uncharacterized protein LOC100878146 isoform X2 [Megachile rotundata]